MMANEQCRDEKLKTDRAAAQRVIEGLKQSAVRHVKPRILGPSPHFELTNVGPGSGLGSYMDEAANSILGPVPGPLRSCVRSRATSRCRRVVLISRSGIDAVLYSSAK